MKRAVKKPVIITKVVKKPSATAAKSTKKIISDDDDDDLDEILKEKNNLLDAISVLIQKQIRIKLLLKELFFHILNLIPYL